MSAELQPSTLGLWERYAMALNEVTDRLQRISRLLDEAGIAFALVGGQAVALWVATKDPAAVRTTKDVDILLRREDLPRARGAAAAGGFDYFEVMGVGMFLERSDPNPRKAVHIVWSGEKVRPDDPLPSSTVDDRQTLDQTPVVSLAGLVRMKLLANRDQDRVHLRDLIGVGLIDRSLVAIVPPELAPRLDALLRESGQ